MSNTPIRIAVSGTSGRMGRQLIKMVSQSEQVILGAALSRAGSGLCGVDAGSMGGLGVMGVMISSNLAAVKEDFDILIDFTCPDASLGYLDFCRRHHKGIVIGTTGFNDVQKEIINAAAEDTGVVFAANFSVGVNLMLKLLEKAAQVMGEESDIEIIEAHHRYKVDNPSGTALAMGEVIAGVFGCKLAHCTTYSNGVYAGERKAKSIGFTTVRAGDILGEHTAMFVKVGERLEITHKALSRMSFARGAVRAAVWLSGQKSGLFDMINVLNLGEL